MNNPIWISHRGLWKDSEENSLDAFRSAVAVGFDYLETDLRISSDGEIFLSHDRSLLRMTGHDRNIDQLPSSELRAINTLKGNHYLSLNEFLKHFYGKRHVFDIKAETGYEVIDRLRHYDLDLHKTIFLFWDAKQEEKFLQQWPAAICFAREEECRKAGWEALTGLPFIKAIQKNRIYSVPPGFKGIPLFTRRIVKAFHRRGAKILAFLPDNTKQQQSAITAGFDYILSDHPPTT